MSEKPFFLGGLGGWVEWEEEVGLMGWMGKVEKRRVWYGRLLMRRKV